MAKNFTICWGSLGTGLWRSTDTGETWQRARLGEGYQGGKSVYDHMRPGTRSRSDECRRFPQCSLRMAEEQEPHDVRQFLG